jgi:hypothetical protein
MADTGDTDATRSRAERGDAALVAQYIHELSERHGSRPDALDDDRRGEDEDGLTGAG